MFILQDQFILANQYLENDKKYLNANLTHLSFPLTELYILQTSLNREHEQFLLPLVINVVFVVFSSAFN
jgi:hypothetical protein